MDYRQVMPEVHWKDAYPYIQREVRAYLRTVEPLETRSTNELLDALLPDHGGDTIVARKRVYSALERMIDPITGEHYLADCFDYSEPRRVRWSQKLIRQKLWHYPTPHAPTPPAEKTCPTCGHRIDE
jgi:hypothetical protein